MTTCDSDTSVCLAAIHSHEMDPGDLPSTHFRTIGYGQAGDVDEATSVRQLLEEHDCDSIHIDLAPVTVRPNLPALAHCLGTLRAGEVLVLPALEHLAGSFPELISRLCKLDEGEIDVVVLDHDIDTRTTSGRALYDTIPALSDFSVNCLRRSTRRGVRSAQASGRRVGRPPAMDDARISVARTMLSRPGHSVSSVARALAISRSTLYKYLPELGSG